jgi:recombination protein RecA
MAKAKEKEGKKTPEELLQELEKKYGLSRNGVKDLVIVDTESIQLNRAMGIGGSALGKIIEVFGPNMCGKTTITLHQIASYQRAFPNRKVALFDYEHSFSKTYARAIGVNVEELLIYQPDNQETGYDMILGLIEKDLVSCIVVDSQTAAAPKAIIDGEMGDATIGLQARNNSKFCLKVKGLLSIHNTTLFLISQTRDKIGGMGDPTTTTGGNAIKFYADARWKVWKTNDKPNEMDKTTIDVIKNKMSNPFGQAKLNILWGIGFDKIGEIIDYALEFGIIKQSGSWFSYNGNNIGQGANSVKELLEDSPDLLLEIREKVMNKLNNVPEEEEIKIESNTDLENLFNKTDEDL